MTDWRLDIFDELSSTSDHCRAAAESGADQGLAILARRQSAGRGTRGRHWVDPGGNLAFSFLLRPAALSPLMGALPFLVAIAVHATLSDLLPPQTDMKIKWPNDILINGQKVAGILIEADSSDTPWIVVGVGVNVASAPILPGRAVTCLGAHNAASLPSVEAIAHSILENFDNQRSRFEKAGFADIRAEWLRRALPLGTALAVSRGESYIYGLFNGLDEEGRLLLWTEHGRVLTFVAGDVLLTD